MRQIWLLALNDLKLTARDRPAFIWLIAMPIAMMWFFGNIGGGGGSGTPTISLSLVNQDDGWLSTALIEELTDESIEIREIDPSRPDDDRPRIRTLVIPEGFTRGALSGEQQTLRLEKESDSNAQYGLAAEVHLTRAIVRTLGRLIEMHEAGGLEATSADGAAALQRFRDMGNRQDLVTLSVSTAGRGEPVPSGRAQSVPGIMTFVVMMMTLIYGGVFLTNEKLSGMLQRQAQLPMTRRAVFLGKLLGRLLMAGIQVLLLVLAGRFLFGVSWGNSPLGLALVLTSFTVAIGAMSTLLGAVLRTPTQASSVGWIGSMVLAALGGCWWPGELMPDWMQTASLALPTAWAMRGFHSLISFGHGVEEVLPPSLALLAFGAVFTGLGARFLRFER
jgi:ABC-type multidrug transport system permease subunit